MTIIHLCAPIPTRSCDWYWGTHYIGCQGTKCGNISQSKTAIAVLTLALLTQGAEAQRAGKKETGQNNRVNRRKTRQRRRRSDDDYKNALKNIPAATEKPDPWKTMR